MLRSRSPWLRASIAAGALSVALSGTLIGLGTGPAGAVRNGPPGVGAGAYMQEGNGSCGQNLSFLPSIGVVGYSRVGTEVTIIVNFQHALPYTEYYMTLWVSAARYGECSRLANLGYVFTNAKGNGFGIFGAYVPWYDTWMFAASEAYTDFSPISQSPTNAPLSSPYGYNDTPSQYLPHTGGYTT